MKLSQYLKSNGISHEIFAAKVGVSRVFITQISNEARYPSYGVAKRIQRATAGSVTIDMLMEKEGDAA